MLRKTDESNTPEKKNKTKYMIASGLIATIVVLSIMVVIYRDVIFTSEIEIEYADGCIERYINKELVTPICEEGRKQEEVYWGEKNNNYDGLWKNINLTFNNTNNS